MENEEQHNEMENAESQLHPLIEQFVEPSKAYFDKMDNFSGQWDDAASDQFKDEVVERCRKTTYNYLKSLVSLTNGYEAILQEAQSLLDWKAGFGGFLSIIDIEMLAERQTSRWLFNRDDQRW